MIIKAIITAVPKDGKNEYTVRIPFFEESTQARFYLQALLCRKPGDYCGYAVDDVVFIGFENDRLDTAIILGKLYDGQEDENEQNHQRITNLDVLGTANLPDSTTIGGYGTEDFFKLYQMVGQTGDLTYEVLE